MIFRANFKQVSIAALSTVFMAAGASATTITFDNLPTLAEFFGSGSPSVYVENNITATAPGDFASYDVAGAVHLDDAGTSFPWKVSLTTGAVFDGIEFDVISESFAEAPYQNILVKGFLGGALAATSTFAMNAVSGTSETFSLGAGFGGIDMLQISASNVGGGFCAPCGHFNLDAVTISDSISPVPLPASLPLLGLAIGAIFMVGRRKKHA